jgi:hypothetical protein
VSDLLRTLRAMHVDGDQKRWETIKAHCSTHVSSPPWCVILMAAALLKDDAIKGSWTRYQAAEPATWSAYLATESRLVYIEYEFDADRYTLNEDT